MACVNNPGTDKKQEIQVCEIKHGVVGTGIYLKGKKVFFSLILSACMITPSWRKIVVVNTGV
ncbi:hypothetical protein [Chitinophaga pinensis]|uniref:hypothetical protein n=1 Tax=Chitinophaga pinensis TaxID=79329 RepID=UPI00019E32D5|nr:hypothetical protein [Chitinophaga pinensis]